MLNEGTTSTGNSFAFQSFYEVRKNFTIENIERNKCSWLKSALERIERYPAEKRNKILSIFSTNDNGVLISSFYKKLSGEKKLVLPAWVFILFEKGVYKELDLSDCCYIYKKIKMFFMSKNPSLDCFSVIQDQSVLYSKVQTDENGVKKEFGDSEFSSERFLMYRNMIFSAIEADRYKRSILKRVLIGKYGRVVLNSEEDVEFEDVISDNSAFEKFINGISDDLTFDEYYKYIHDCVVFDGCEKTAPSGDIFNKISGIITSDDAFGKYVATICRIDASNRDYNSAADGLIPLEAFEEFSDACLSLLPMEVFHVIATEFGKVAHAKNYRNLVNRYYFTVDYDKYKLVSDKWTMNNVAKIIPDQGYLFFSKTFFKQIPHAKFLSFLGLCNCDFHRKYLMNQYYRNMSWSEYHELPVDERNEIPKESYAYFSVEFLKECSEDDFLRILSESSDHIHKEDLNFMKKKHYSTITYEKYKSFDEFDRISHEDYVYFHQDFFDKCPISEFIELFKSARSTINIKDFLTKYFSKFTYAKYSEMDGIDEMLKEYPEAYKYFAPNFLQEIPTSIFVMVYDLVRGFCNDDEKVDFVEDHFLSITLEKFNSIDPETKSKIPNDAYAFIPADVLHTIDIDFILKLANKPDSFIDEIVHKTFIENYFSTFTFEEYKRVGDVTKIPIRAFMYIPARFFNSLDSIGTFLEINAHIRSKIPKNKYHEILKRYFFNFNYKKYIELKQDVRNAIPVEAYFYMSSSGLYDMDDDTIKAILLKIANNCDIVTSINEQVIQAFFNNVTYSRYSNMIDSDQFLQERLITFLSREYLLSYSVDEFEKIFKLIRNEPFYSQTWVLGKYVNGGNQLCKVLDGKHTGLYPLVYFFYESSQFCFDIDQYDETTPLFFDAYSKFKSFVDEQLKNFKVKSGSNSVEKTRRRLAFLRQIRDKHLFSLLKRAFVNTKNNIKDDLQRYNEYISVHRQEPNLHDRLFLYFYSHEDLVRACASDFLESAKAIKRIIPPDKYRVFAKEYFTNQVLSDIKHLVKLLEQDEYIFYLYFPDEAFEDMELADFLDIYESLKPKLSVEEDRLLLAKYFRFMTFQRYEMIDKGCEYRIPKYAYVYFPDIFYENIDTQELLYILDSMDIDPESKEYMMMVHFKYMTFENFAKLPNEVRSNIPLSAYKYFPDSFFKNNGFRRFTELVPLDVIDHVPARMILSFYYEKSAIQGVLGYSDKQNSEEPSKYEMTEKSVEDEELDDELNIDLFFERTTSEGGTHLVDDVQEQDDEEDSDDSVLNYSRYGEHLDYNEDNDNEEIDPVLKALLAEGFPSQDDTERHSINEKLSNEFRYISRAHKVVEDARRRDIREIADLIYKYLDTRKRKREKK